MPPNRPLALLTLLAAIVALTACASQQAARHVDVKTDPIASEFTPRQVARLLGRVGYQPIRWYDFESGQTGTVISTERETKMKFRSPRHPDREVYFRFFIDTKKLRLSLVEPGREQLSREAAESYQRILQALETTFGADNVSELRRSLMPAP